MNVMAQAHKITRATVDASPVKLCYRSLFKAALKDCHKMNKQNDWKAAQIKSSEERIVELEAIEHLDGFIVVVGDNIRLPIDEVKGSWCRVEKASIFWYREDAQRLAGRIRNGNNEVGQVVKKIDQIKWEIEEQKKLIESLKNF